MKRRDFLKFAPIIPVIAVGTAAANANPPDTLQLPVTFKGEDGDLIIEEKDGAITLNRSDAPEKFTAIKMAPAHEPAPKPFIHTHFNALPKMEPGPWVHNDIGPETLTFHSNADIRVESMTGMLIVNPSNG